VEENRGQGMISDRQKWYRYQKKEEVEAAHGQEFRKAQQRRREDKGRSDKPSKC